jgi:hypothetical protein
LSPSSTRIAAELGRGHHRVEDQGGAEGRPELLEGGAAEGGLAGADLAGELDEPLAFADAVEQMLQSLAMPGGEVEKARIGVMLNGASRSP